MEKGDVARQQPRPFRYFDLVMALFVAVLLISNVEAVMTPATYRIVRFLKRAEQEDYYDYDTDFNPFRLREGW